LEFHDNKQKTYIVFIGSSGSNRSQDKRLSPDELEDKTAEESENQKKTLYYNIAYSSHFTATIVSNQS